MLHYGYVKVTEVTDGKVSSRLVEARKFANPDIGIREMDDRLIEREEILESLVHRYECNDKLRGHLVCW